LSASISTGAVRSGIRPALTYLLAALSIPLTACHSWHLRNSHPSFTPGYRKFRFTPSPESSEQSFMPADLAVVTAEDLRGNFKHDFKQLALVPAIPWSVSHSERPETTFYDDSENLYGFNPSEDLAKAFADEIRNAHIFSSVRNGGTASSKSRYVFELTIQDLHAAEGYLTYGVSGASLLLHLLQAPEGTLRGFMAMRVELRENERLLWSAEFGQGATCLTWILDSNEAAHLNWIYSELAQENIPRLVQDLRNELLKQSGRAPRFVPPESSPPEPSGSAEDASVRRPS